MISAREVYYFNEALDGKEIFGVRKSESLIEDLKSNISVEESLIKKGLLDADGKFNESSEEIIKNLKEYKQCKEYINFNDTFFSVNYGEERGIYLKQNCEGMYEIKKVVKPILVNSLMSYYPFLCKCKEFEEKIENKIEEIKSIEHEIIMKDYLHNVKENEWFYVKKGFSEDAHTFCIYFLKNKVSYKYDVIKKKLIKRNPSNIKSEILRIFEIEEEI